MSKIIQHQAKILSNLRLRQDYYKLALSLAGMARIAKPGQFLMLRISRGYQPFLRRPFSIHRVSPGRIEILYQVVGKGTKMLSKKKPGERLDILGPLGNGFEYRTAKNENRRPILVAGGMGVAPLFFLAQRLINRTPKTEHRTPIILIGAKTKKAIVSKKEFASLGLDVKISSDDGSAGFRGKVTDLLKRVLRATHDARRATIYACGPKAMLSEIAAIAKRYHLPAQVSLDEYMACGLGVCLGCAVQTKDGQQLVCRDGPVFDIAKIKY